LVLGFFEKPGYHLRSYHTNEFSKNDTNKTTTKKRETGQPPQIVIFYKMASFFMPFVAPTTTTVAATHYWPNDSLGAGWGVAGC